MQILTLFLSLFLYFFFFPIRSVLAPRCPVRATSAGAFLCAFLAHHCASPLFLVVASDGIRQKSGEVSLTASLSWSFRGILSRFLAFMRRVSMRGFVCSFPRNFIPLPYLTSCPVMVYTFSPRRITYFPLLYYASGRAFGSWKYPLRRLLTKQSHGLHPSPSVSRYAND